ncbi:MAG: fasciclin domain-containing protein [Lewinella sp.]|nr:fasciclin domain-containing protein [Lewinella sp.]
MGFKKFLLALFFLPSLVSAQTVVDVIVNSPDHNTLEAAVIAAGLQTALSGDGPFTVFAPTDAAFDALPAGTIDALLADPQGALTDILTYHVASGQVLSTDLSDGQVIPTLNGKNVTVTINADGVFINNAKVTVADIQADNGVVHVIDAVLIPMDVAATEPAITELKGVVSPNPVSETGFIDLSAVTDGDILVKVFDGMGRLVKESYHPNPQDQFQTGDLPAGILNLQIIAGGKMYTTRIVKQ